MSSNKKILIFKIGGEEFAADIMQIERILGFFEPTRIPEAPEFVRGVIKYQERIIPVIDLKRACAATILPVLLTWRKTPSP